MNRQPKFAPKRTGPIVDHHERGVTRREKIREERHTTSSSRHCQMQFGSVGEKAYRSAGRKVAQPSRLR